MLAKRKIQSNCFDSIAENSQVVQEMAENKRYLLVFYKLDLDSFIRHVFNFFADFYWVRLKQFVCTVNTLGSLIK